MNRNVSFAAPVGLTGFGTNASFTRWTSATGAAGVAHEIPVPRDMQDRYVWIAADAPHSDTDALWYLDAQIEFLMGEVPVGIWPILTGNQIVPGKNLNIYSPKSGSGLQPPLTVTVYETMWQENKSLLCPCFFFRAQCDRIRYRINALSVGAGGVLDSIKVTRRGLISSTTAVSAYAFNVSGGGGSGYDFTAVFDGNGYSQQWVDEVIVTLPGTGFTGPPTVTHNSSTPAFATSPQYLARIGGLANVVTGMAVMSLTPGGKL